MAVYRCPVRIEHDTAGGVMFNVWHVRVGLSSDPANDSVLGQAGGPLDTLDTFYGGLPGILGHAASLTIGDGVTDITDPLAPRYVDVTPRTRASGSTNGLTPLLAICISWQTTLARRSGRGRTFIGPLLDTVHDGAGGAPTLTAVTTIRDAAQTLVNTSAAVNGWAFGVRGYAEPGNTLSGKVLRDFTGRTVQQRYSYLSSRRD